MPKRRSAPDSQPNMPSPSSRDDMMRDLNRLLERQQFGSIEEVNAFMERELAGKPIPHLQPANDRERAEDLVQAARNERSIPRLRAQVAKALKLDPDCMTAHLLLAEVAEAPTEILAHSRKAIAAGDRVLSDVLAEADGALWHHQGGRPYLRARLIIAELLWQMGDRQLALEEARTILRFNAGDNQGVRYRLLEWLMQAGSVAEIEAVLSAHDEHSAAWTFTAALHRYRTGGRSTAAAKALRSAMSVNVHVVPMLLGTLPLPPKPPEMYGNGDEDEAALYVFGATPAWYDAIGAMEWLTQAARPKPPGAAGARKRR